MRCLKDFELMVPVPYLSRTLKAILIISSSLTAFILSDIMLQNSGNSIIPEPSVSYCGFNLKCHFEERRKYFTIALVFNEPLGIFDLIKKISYVILNCYKNGL